MTVKEVSRRTGVSIRALQYYDSIGLLCPAERTAAGYRVYEEKDLERLQQILLFRELDFSLETIKRILNDPGFDREEAFRQQIDLLTMKRERLDGILAMVRDLLEKGGHEVSFKEFDDSRIEAYAAQAKERWGATDAYKEYEKKAEGRSRAAEKVLGKGLMEIFVRFGAVRSGDPAGEEAQALVKELQNYITDNFYTCTGDILYGLGQMYGAGGEFTENIDAAGGEGTALFAQKAIELYCLK